ncbi:hypothetical protein GGI12_001950 [Dipsacomyces acuminosporus]|nr:hypothetical protein GGI12_001950 [Dipsacomyces acuminosporus]
MRTFAIAATLATCAIAAPLAVRQLPGDSVNGPVGINDANINNGAQASGVLKDTTSFEGALISNPVGNDITKVNKNVNIHDNAFLNPTVNSVNGGTGDAVVGNGNHVFPAVGGAVAFAPFLQFAPFHGAFFKRQIPGATSSTVGINTPSVNTGSSSEGDLASGLSFDKAQLVNPVGNDFNNFASNTNVKDNNFDHPTFNSVSGTNEAALAGDHNIFIPVHNEAGAIKFDNGDLFNAVLAGAALAPAPGFVPAPGFF